MRLTVVAVLSLSCILRPQSYCAVAHTKVHKKTIIESEHAPHAHEMDVVNFVRAKAAATGHMQGTNAPANTKKIIEAAEAKRLEIRKYVLHNHPTTVPTTHRHHLLLVPSALTLSTSHSLIAHCPPRTVHRPPPNVHQAPNQTLPPTAHLRYLNIDDKADGAKWLDELLFFTHERSKDMVKNKFKESIKSGTFKVRVHNLARPLSLALSGSQ